MNVNRGQRFPTGCPRLSHGPQADTGKSPARQQITATAPPDLGTLNFDGVLLIGTRHKYTLSISRVCRRQRLGLFDYLKRASANLGGPFQAKCLMCTSRYGPLLRAISTNYFGCIGIRPPTFGSRGTCAHEYNKGQKQSSFHNWPACNRHVFH